MDDMTDAARIRKLRHALEQTQKAINQARRVYRMADALNWELTHIESNIVASLEATNDKA
jgi:hypothetical protein